VELVQDYLIIRGGCSALKNANDNAFEANFSGNISTQV
jgi:hypothetical protein